MKARASHSALGLGLTALLASGPSFGSELKDLHFAEALYYAEQGQYLEALERLDAELGQYHDLDEPQLAWLQKDGKKKHVLHIASLSQS